MMNRITKPPFMKERVETPQPTQEVVAKVEDVVEPTTTNIPQGIYEPELSTQFKPLGAVEICDTLSNKPKPQFQTVSIKCENSITIKYRDNFYKFGLSEEKIIPNDLRNDFVITKEEVENTRKELTDSINKHIDNQIQELIDSMN